MYKLRAECLKDVFTFLTLLGQVSHTSLGQFEVSPSFIGEVRLPDVELIFQSSCSLAELQQVLSHVVDSHVMKETLAPIPSYTGRRTA